MIDRPDNDPVWGPGMGADPDDRPEPVRKAGEGAVLLIAVFVVATCGLAYELVIASTGAYIAGDGVRQFSITIGVFLSAMGVGSYLSRAVRKRELEVFISVELVIGVVGGFSNTIMYLVYGYLSGYQVVMYGLLVFIGTLIGLEIPLLIRLLSAYGPLRLNISNVLALDYVGALIVAVCFPLVLLPNLGLMRTALLFGILNVIVGLGNWWFFRHRKLPKVLAGSGVACLVLLLVSLVGASGIIRMIEARQYDDEIILVRQTPYQRIVLTRWRDDLRLFLDGNIQFSSRDEHRYHEVLVHPALSTTSNRDSVLVLGGGDGLAVREVLKYQDVKRVTLVDLDRQMVELCRTNPHVKRLNRGSLASPRVKHVYRDAWAFLREDKGVYNAIIVDLPDPSSEKLAKLYTLQFYKMIKRHLAADGIAAVQSSSPYYTRRAFWTIVRTLEAAGLKTAPMRVHVPSFGEWAVTLAGHHDFPWSRTRVRVKTRFLTDEIYPTLFVFPADLKPVDVTVSTLDNPTVVQEYLKDWREYFK